MTPPVAILAGGLATRLRPLTEKVPKALLELAGKPFIGHQLRLLREKGVTRAVLCVGYRGEQIRDYVKNGEAFDMRVDYSFDGGKLLGTGGALKKAQNLLGDVFWALYGDSYLETDFDPIARFFAGQSEPALMTVCRNQNRWDKSNVEYDAPRVVKYDKKEKTANMRYIDYGLLLLRASALNSVPADAVADLSDVLSRLAREGDLLGFEVKERFYEIGSPEGLTELENHLKRKETPPRRR